MSESAVNGLTSWRWQSSYPHSVLLRALMLTHECVTSVLRAALHECYNSYGFCMYLLFPTSSFFVNHLLQNALDPMLLLVAANPTHPSLCTIMPRSNPDSHPHLAPCQQSTSGEWSHAPVLSCTPLAWPCTLRSYQVGACLACFPTLHLLSCCCCAWV